MMIMETVTKSAACAFAPGMTFCPPDQELTDRYLHSELAGHPVPGTAGFVHHVDIYSADPEHLVENLAPAPGTGKGDKPPVWYFVSPVRSAGGRKTAGGRKARAVVGGTWHGENRFAVKGSKLGGTVRSFTYTRKSASGERVERLGWLMKEYEVPAQEGGGDRVLCKIYRTPRKSNKSTAASSSTTISSSLSDSAGKSKKRKAPGDHPDAPTPSTRHGFIEGSGESDNYGAAAYFHGTATYVPGGETQTMQLQPSAQESFLPSSEFYGTTDQENIGHVFMERSGESEHYGAAACFYGTATHLPGGETMQLQLQPCAQESFFPSTSEIYGTTDTQGKDNDDLDELLKLGAGTDYQGSEEEIQAMIRELSW